MIGSKSLDPFAEFYRSDLPCYVALEAELDLREAFHQHWKALISRASVVLSYAWEFREHYLWLYVLMSNHFSPWGGCKPTLAVQWYQKDWME